MVTGVNEDLAPSELPDFRQNPKADLLRKGHNCIAFTNFLYDSDSDKFDVSI